MALDRYDVERAIKQSGLPWPARLILLTLLTHTVNETPAVPLQRATPVTVLVKETGLSRSALSGHLKHLEADGWVKR